MLVGPARQAWPFLSPSVSSSPQPSGSPGASNILLDKLLNGCWPGSSSLHPGLLLCLPLNALGRGD